MKRKKTETFCNKVHRLLSEDKKLFSPQNAQVVGALDNGLTTLLIVLNMQDNGFLIEFEKPFVSQVFDSEGTAY